MIMPAASPDAVRAELDKIVAAQAFSGANRSIQLLRYVVTETLAGRAAYLKEYSLGAEALGRGPSFDPRADPIARVEASRLRNRLELYFATEGHFDELLITLPKGGYVPQFELRPVVPPAARPLSLGGSKSVQLAIAVALGFVIVPALAFWLGRGWSAHLPAAPDPAPLRMSVALGVDGTLGSEVGNDLAISPDGGTLVFVMLRSDGSTRLFARRLDQLEARELPGTVGARGPFFSPDNRWVGFWSQGKLRKTLVEGGGSPVALADTTDLLGASWGEHGEIVAALNSMPTLWRVPENGGTPVPLVDVAATGSSPRWPQLLPGAGAVLFTAMAGTGDRDVAVVSLADGAVKTLIRGGTYGRYLANGDLVYVDRGTLFAVPFDAERLEIRGTPVAVLDSVDYSAGFGYAEVDVARNGTLVYRRSEGSGLTTVAWVDGSNRIEPVLAEPAHYLWPRLSPDGTRIAYALLDDSDYDIWSYDVRSAARTRMTMTEGDEVAPLWTVDGSAVVYSGASGLGWQRSDGAGRPALVVSGVAIPWSFSPDGARLAYHRMNAATGFDLWTVPLAAGADGPVAGAEERFYGTDVFDTYPTFSPDGRWIAYGSNESGVWEVYVRAFPDNGRALRVSSNGGRIPAWSKNSAELLYETNDHRLMAAAFRVTNGELVMDAPRVWSTVQLADTGVLANFDVAPDGRVLALLAAETNEPHASRATVTVLANAFTEFRRVREGAGAAR
jgi:serine/threonine-protein kinase